MECLDFFEVLWTADGSPSLRGKDEPMHHLGGAYSETQYIYGEALRRFTREATDLEEWNVLVVGLGLGYIELLSIAEALKNRKRIRICSYEIEPLLVKAFLSWLRGELSSDSSLIYERMADFFQKDYPNLDLRRALLQHFESGDWVIRGGLDLSSLPEKAHHILLFDAFSGKATPDLWTEAFLKRFLLQGAHSSSVFATYACTGVLRRALKESGFDVEKKPGFQGKRDSTIATKGLLGVRDGVVVRRQSPEGDCG